jgi:hypothetical protein
MLGGASIAVRRPAIALDLRRVPANSDNMLWIGGGLALELAKQGKSLIGEVISRLRGMKTQETKVWNS